MTLTFVGSHFSLLSILCNRSRVAFVLFLASAPALGDDAPDAAFPHARDLEAIAFHLEGLREDGIPIPAPQTSAEFVEV